MMNVLLQWKVGRDDASSSSESWLFKGLALNAARASHALAFLAQAICIRSAFAHPSRLGDDAVPGPLGFSFASYVMGIHVCHT